VDQTKIKREISEAHADLVSAKASIDQSDFKWAIIKAYYSMFHGGKSLAFSVGYSEKSHECVIVAVEEFFTSTGKLPSSIVDHMKDAKSAREAADYGLTYGGDAAKMIIQEAETVYQLISEYHAKHGITDIPL
jgi:uncharacterized protein (UPF0332 family)